MTPFSAAIIIIVSSTTVQHRAVLLVYQQSHRTFMLQYLLLPRWLKSASLNVWASLLSLLLITDPSSVIAPTSQFPRRTLKPNHTDYFKGLNHYAFVCFFCAPFFRCGQCPNKQTLAPNYGQFSQLSLGCIYGSYGCGEGVRINIKERNDNGSYC